MLPGLAKLLSDVPSGERSKWVVNPIGLSCRTTTDESAFRPQPADLRSWAARYCNLAIARACGVSEMAVRKWLKALDAARETDSVRLLSHVPPEEIELVRARSCKTRSRRQTGRLSKEYVGRVISLIGEEASVIVQRDDPRTGQRIKFASAHDLRRGCAQRLINCGVSAETLKVVMRHKSFATTEKHYGAMRSAPAAAAEILQKLNLNASSDALVGGLVGDKR